MTGLSASGETNVLNALLGAPGTPIAYVSLHTADPGPTGLNEVTGAPAYVRQGPIAFTASGANPTIDANTNTFAFPTATVNWGTITHFGLWTAATAGTFLGSQALTTPRTILANDSARFIAGALQISAD